MSSDFFHVTAFLSMATRVLLGTPQTGEAQRRCTRCRPSCIKVCRFLATIRWGTLSDIMFLALLFSYSASATSSLSPLSMPTSPGASTLLKYSFIDNLIRFLLSTPADNYPHLVHVTYDPSLFAFNFSPFIEPFFVCIRCTTCDKSLVIGSLSNLLR